MFRKLAFVLGASALIGTAALIPTSASAHMHGHHGHGHWHGGFAVGIIAPTTVVASECYTVKKLVNTPFGPRIRRFTVCG
jgi:hypothetical protein